MRLIKRIPWLLLVACFTGVSIADQTDARLDELFQTLQSSHELSELDAVEASIWEIWYDSGEMEIDVMMQEAAALENKGDLAAAEMKYAAIIEKAPLFSEGWNRRATIRFYRRNYDGSLADIQQTLKLEPRHFGAIWGLGMILGARKEYEHAILAFEKLLEIKPNSEDALPRIEMLKQAQVEEAV